MKRKSSSYCAQILFTALLVLVAGCPREEAVTLNSLRHANIRTELKSNFKSAFDNLAREAKSSSSGLQSAISNIQRLVKFDLAKSLGIGDLDGLNAEFVGTVVNKILESELAQALLSETNIASRTDNEVVYVIDRSICDKFLGMTPSKDSDALAASTCKRFLEKNALELHVKTQTDQGLELELWHGAIASGATSKKFVVSLVTSSNALGSRLNLDGVKDFASAIFEMNIVNLPIAGIKSLKGAISMFVRFTTDKAASGCKNAERLCFSANVDEDISAEVQGEEKLSLHFGHSAKDNPSATIAATADNGFTGTFNLGALDGRYSDRHLYLESSRFKVTIPELKEDSGIQFTLENFKPGAKPSLFEAGGKKIVIDLKNDARLIESFKFFMNDAKVLLEMSPFNLLLSLSDETNNTCKTYESIELVSDTLETTLVEFLSANSKNLKFASLAPSPSCTEDNLMGFRIFSSWNVTSDNCNEPGVLALKQGSLSLAYKYHVNNEEEQDITMSVFRNQCISP